MIAPLLYLLGKATNLATIMLVFLIATDLTYSSHVSMISVA
ncbi:hypothetical protein B4071_4295 [Bacillus subtilis]|nr:hypothetical protein B4071_4295 [Bacillus subtilis]RPJ98130.1 hypothetical protein EH11_04211 [Bacillus subtilis]